MIQSYKQITGKYLKSNKKRTILTIVGVILSVALISSIGFFIKGMQDAEIESAKADYGSYHLAYTKVTDSLMSEIRNNPKVSRSGLYLQEDIKLNDKLSATEVMASDKALELLPIKAKKGRLPQNDKEVALESWILKYIDKDAALGSKISIAGKEYTLVGTLEDNISTQFNKNGLILTKNNSINVGKAVLLVEISSKADIRSTVKELKALSDEKSCQENRALLMMENASSDTSTSSGILKVVSIIIGIVVIATIAVIYNSFQISVVERMKQFGLLRAVGTTPKQIRRIVLREATFILLIGIPIGLVCGVIAICGISFAYKLIGGQSVNFKKLTISPMVMIISALVGAVSIYISALLPALYAGRISPLAAISSRTSIKKEKIKRRNNFIAKKLFGFEGALAAKNIKRNRKRYRITVFSIVLSVMLFIAFKSFTDMTLNITPRINESSNIHFSVYDNNRRDANASDASIDNNVAENIKSVKYVNKVYKQYDVLDSTAIISNDKKIQQVADIKAFDGGSIYKNANFNGEKCTSINAGVTIYDENSLNAAKKYIESGSIDTASLNSGEGVILIGKNKIYNMNKKKSYNGAFTDIKAGDQIYINIAGKAGDTVTDNGYKKEADKKDAAKTTVTPTESSYKKVKVIAVLSQNPFDYSAGDDALNFITTEQAAGKLFGKGCMNLIRLNIVLNDTKDEEAANAAIENVLKTSPSLEILNYIDMNKRDKSDELMIEILLYGFVVVISLISCINIINTLTTNIILRRREFATLKSIGLTQKGLKKMVVIEGLLYGIMGAIYGSIIGTLLSYALFNGVSGVSEIPWSIPWKAIAIASVFALAIGYLSVLSPLSKIKRDNLIESIREE